MNFGSAPASAAMKCPEAGSMAEASVGADVLKKIDAVDGCEREGDNDQ